MLLSQINPYVRYAAHSKYSAHDNNVYVCDCRIIYITGGTGKMIVESAEHRLTPGTLFYCREGTNYNFCADGTISYISINFDLTQQYSNIKNSITPIPIKSVNDIDLSNILKCPDIESENFNMTYTVIDNASDFERDLKRAVKEFALHKICYTEYVSSIVKMLICNIIRASVFKTKNSVNAAEFAIDYIKENYAKQISNKEIASFTGYHEYHLNRLFLKYTGMSLHKYLIKTRINEAKRLLTDTDIPVSVIAEMTGFINKTYFSKYFKSECKIPPTQYRQKNKDTI